MVPPYRIEKDLRKHSCKEGLRTIFLLYEGLNTEKYLINPLLSSNSIVKKGKIRFRPIIKEENDAGITNPFSLVKYAKRFIKNETAKDNFLSGRDRVMIVFDLDVLNNNQEEMNRLLRLKTSDMILCYTNPAIELFLLLTLNQGYEQIVEPNKNKILANEKNEHGERFVYNLALESVPGYSKSADADFRFILDNIDNALMQEKRINNKISKAANKLTSNIAYLLKKFDNNDFNIEYWLFDSINLKLLR